MDWPGELERMRTRWRACELSRRLRAPAVKAMALALPVAVLLSGNVSAASRTVSWNVAGPQTAGDQAWLDSLTGPVTAADGGPAVASTDPDLPVLPAGGNPADLVLVPAAGTAPPAAAPNGSTLPPQLDLSGPPQPGETVVTTELAASGIPVRALKSYLAAAAVTARLDPACRLHWSLLAGIGRVESNHGRFGGAHIAADGTVSPPIYGPRLDATGSMALVRDTDGGRLDGDPAIDRAVGPMQFLPGTWSTYGSDADGDGRANPQDMDDAALSAARYLCAGNGDLSTQVGRWNAVLRYNHSDSYAAHVISLAASYATGAVVPVETSPPGVSRPAPTAPTVSEPGASTPARRPGTPAVPAGPGVPAVPSPTSSTPTGATVSPASSPAVTPSDSTAALPTPDTSPASPDATPAGGPPLTTDPTSAPASPPTLPPITDPATSSPSASPPDASPPVAPSSEPASPAPAPAPASPAPTDVAPAASSAPPTVSVPAPPAVTPSDPPPSAPSAPGSSASSPSPS